MIITGMRIERWIGADKIRSICINYGWYTHGTIADYTKMLDKVRNEGQNMSDQFYFMIAEDIYNHSDIDKMCGEYGIDEEECIRIILSKLINESWNHLEVKVDETR